MRRVSPTMVAAAVAMALIACGGADRSVEDALEPTTAATSLDLPPGHRHWIISVENQSAAPARLVVAEDTVGIGDLVGAARPATIPPGMTLDVTFIVPPGDTWAIFVNRSAVRGPLLLARDVPADFSGRLPVEFVVLPGGDPQMTTEGDLGPGWLGE